MHVNHLAKAVGTTPDTVRYYTRIGLLNPEKNRHNSYKCYGVEDEKRLRFILCSRQLGLSVDEVRKLLAHADDPGSRCPELVDLLGHKLDEANRRLADTRTLCEMLSESLQHWRRSERPPTGGVLSDIIDNFGESPGSL